MELRKLTREDIDLFTENRMYFVNLIRDIKDEDSFREKTRTYLMEHIDKNDFSAYVALDEGKIVAACMACIYQLAPLPSCPDGLVAELLNVNTDKNYQRRGLS